MKKIKNINGFTLIEVMIVLILLTLSFMVFLRALNTGKSVRANSELRTIQGVILNSIENEITIIGITNLAVIGCICEVEPNASNKFVKKYKIKIIMTE